MTLEGISGLPMFEAMAGGTQKRLLKDRKSYLSKAQVRYFFHEMDKTLTKFAEMSYDTFMKNEYYKSAGVHEMNWDDSDVAYRGLFSTIKGMKRGVAFSVSCAGFKSDFHSCEDLKKDLVWDDTKPRIDNLREMHTGMEELKVLVLNKFKGLVSRAPEGGFLEHQSSINLDIGVEILPRTNTPVSFMLRGNVAKMMGEFILRMCDVSLCNIQQEHRMFFLLQIRKAMMGKGLELRERLTPTLTEFQKAPGKNGVKL